MSKTMREFILWSNCNNSCDFCWQRYKKDESTILIENEMLKSIKATSEALDEINNGDDILLVGGEIFFNYYVSVSIGLRKLIDKCIDMIKEDRIRYLYVNTNIMYEDKSNLNYLLNSFTKNSLEDRLKFTTSYDTYGRFLTRRSKHHFFSSLRLIKDKYPKIKVVINVIVTKQTANNLDNILKFCDDILKKEYGVRYVNFIPYIPVPDRSDMGVDFKNIVKVLVKQESIEPGYINKYIDDFDLNQNKILYEYHKDKGYIECTAKYSNCGHNENFKKVLGGECYICKLKEVFR